MLFVSPARRPRTPTTRTLAAGRRQAVRHLRMLDAMVRHGPAVGVLSSPQAAPVRAAVRSAAVCTCIITLHRDALQRLSAWLALPLCSAATLFLTAELLGRWHTHPPIAHVVLLGIGCLVFNIVLLVCAVVAGRTAFHAAATAVVALVDVVVLLASPTHLPTASQILIVLTLGSAAIYLAFAPLVLVAYATALRLARLVDPRARIILGLLRCLHHTAVGTAWLHDRASRNRVLKSLEQVARTAQNDLPRLLPRPATDAQTQARLKEQAYAIATRLRQCKQRAAMPAADAGGEVPVELAGLLTQACRQEWNDLRAGDPPSRLPGRVERVARRLAAALLLSVAAFAVPAAFGSSISAATTRNFRDILLVSSVACLVPLPQDVVKRIPDTFAGTLK